MSRYIDAELAVKHIEEMTLENERMQSNFSANWIIDFLESFPTADVEPVVHCKDCKWFNKSGCAIEIVDDSDMPNENDYCSFVEKAFANGAKMDWEENQNGKET